MNTESKKINKNEEFVIEIKQTHYNKLGNQVVKQLQKNGFDSRYFDDRDSLINHVMSFIKKDMTVGIGGSQTIKQLGLLELISEKKAIIFDHNDKNLSKQEKIEVMRKEITSDLFLCSSNAVTINGELFNVDGNGNRVAALSFGPKKVIVVVGINKICFDESEAIGRIKTFAAPQNFIRLNLDTPCVKIGYCTDCNLQQRGCNIYSKIKRKSPIMDISVFIVGEQLGF